VGHGDCAECFDLIFESRARYLHSDNTPIDGKRLRITRKLKSRRQTRRMGSKQSANVLRFVVFRRCSESRWVLVNSYNLALIEKVNDLFVISWRFYFANLELKSRENLNFFELQIFSHTLGNKRNYHPHRSFRRVKKASSSTGFVSISASCFLVETYLILISPSGLYVVWTRLRK
jgi:hypothetical protein